MEQQQIAKLQQDILAYYRDHGRDLPWRKTDDPYCILVSEIMLQQTQVDRVIPKYLAFIHSFPDFAALANADTKELLVAWQGLGYNNRALRLRSLAQIVTKDHGGKLPQTVEALENLPGIGKYTARSVLIFAFNKDIVTVDTNIRRILMVELNLGEEVTEKELYFHAQRLLPVGRSRDWHNALMDYGSTMLSARKTGIKPASKQSAFKDSDRYYRGQILKRLLTAPLRVSDVQTEYVLSSDRAKKILTSMEKDSLITVDRDVIVLR